MNERSRESGEGPSLFDREGALRQVDGDEGILRELADAFLEQAPELMGRIRAAVRESEARELRRGAHTLKGSASVFAAAPVAEAALAVESLAREERLDEAGDAIERLTPLVEGLVAELRGYLEEG